MNDTTVIRVAGGVAAYVREVRAELADLPSEDVDDLTGGMEADLTELEAECGGDLAGRLGSPKVYAAELRAAAGLSEPAGGSRRRRRSLGEQAALDRASFTRLTERHPWLRSVTAFLVTLRPAWWVLRGYLAVWALWSLIMGMRGIGPHDVIHFTAAIAAIVVSVRLGQGWLQGRALTRPLLVLANAAAVIVTLIASTAGVTSGEGNFYEATYTPPPGLLFDGQAVVNVYAYDSEGQRITGVRLFGQDGRPLDGDQSLTDDSGNPIGQDVNGNPMAVVRDSSGASVMNVYPRALVGSDPWQVTDPANPQLNPPPPVWTPPMSIVPLASSVTPTATSKPVPSSSASTTSTKAPS